MQDSESDRELLGRYAATGGNAPFRLLPSKERSFILWLNVRQGIWGAMDPPAAEAFLRKNSIDEVEMKRLADEKFLNPY